MEIDLAKVFNHSLTLVPITFARIDGSPYKTERSAFMEKLEGMIVSNLPTEIDVSIICHANMGLDWSCTRFDSGADWNNVPFQAIYAGMYLTEMMILRFTFNYLSLASMSDNITSDRYDTNSLATSFSFQTHMVRKTGDENRCQKMRSIYDTGFWSLCHGYKALCQDSLKLPFSEFGFL